jgi:RHS repeat-associated protein
VSRTVALIVLTALFLAASATAQQCPPANSSNWCSGLYQYDGTGNIKAIGADTYLYDALGRLTSGTADVQRTGVPSRQTYTYDPFGNRTGVSRDAGSINCVGGCEIPIVVDAGTNHITNNAAHYDEGGNLDFIQATVGNSNYPATYTYDAAGSLAHANSTDNREFIYTADDERIATKNGVSWTWTLRGADNKVLREYSSAEVNGQPTANLQWLKDYVWRDGLLLASASPITPGSSSTAVQHYHLDHLGTPRVVTTSAGAVLGIHTYYAFGAELDLTPKESIAELMKFTGQERDVLPGGPLTLDAMHARYQIAALGRFLSIDPILGRSTSSQSWNRYTYVSDNPLNLTDPTGECERKDGKPPCSDMSITVTAAAPTEAELKRDAAIQIAKDTVDGSAFTIFSKSGVGNVMAGLYNDKPSQIAKGVAQEVMLAGPGAVSSGLKPLAAVGNSLLPSADITVTTIVNTPRVLARAASVGAKDLGHNLPVSFDNILAQTGQFQIKSANYIEFSLPGFINSHAGEYQLGGKLVDGILYVTHRGFQSF